MGKDFFEASPVARQTFEVANKVIGFDLSSICFAGPEDRLNQTDVSQPAIYTTGVACFRAAQAAGKIHPESVTGYAGLSLGEYTALHLAGVFGFEDGLKLVAARGRYMQEAAVASPSGMVAVIGADENQINEICHAARGEDVLVPANFNAPGQVVVSGSKSACERALAEAEKRGLKAVALKVAGAFHSPLMRSGADRMAGELEKVEFSSPTRPVYSNVTAAAHTDTASIKRLLVDQIVKPVRWEQSVQAMLGLGETTFVELAPGRTLAGLMKRISRRQPIESLESAATLGG